MKIFRLRDYDAFIAHSERTTRLRQDHENAIRKSIPSGLFRLFSSVSRRTQFSVKGYSYPAGKMVNFIVDFKHSDSNGNVNWRERVCCPETYFNNRMRAAIHLFDIEMNPYPNLKLYITEQVTPLYKYFSTSFPQTVGSEFIGREVPYGCIDKNGTRNETLCALTFPDNSFDALVSFDVFEHIPDYETAFRECARVLKPGAKMMWSVPFVSSSKENMIRATVSDGSITHVLPPEYHGDPLSDTGILCFQYFGWDMLAEVRAAGFRDSYALCYQSIKFGYLGADQFMFVAVK